MSQRIYARRPATKIAPLSPANPTPRQLSQTKAAASTETAVRPERAERLGHHLSQVPVTAARPAANHPGRPLPESMRERMEVSFGHDFSSVRIHEGPQAEGLGATAYTQGQDIHFAPGKYRPSSHEGRQLIGHELTHVVQQRAGRVAVPQGKGAPINAEPHLEAEADHAGAKAARGEQAAVQGASRPRATITAVGKQRPQRSQAGGGLTRPAPRRCAEKGTA
jgi:hypothetical protein